MSRTSSASAPIRGAKLARVAAYARKVVEETADAPGRPEFRRAGPSEEDLEAVRGGLSKLLENADRLRWPEGKREQAAVNKLERSGLVAQFVGEDTNPECPTSGRIARTTPVGDSVVEEGGTIRYWVTPEEPSPAPSKVTGQGNSGPGNEGQGNANGHGNGNGGPG